MRLSVYTENLLSWRNAFIFFCLYVVLYLGSLAYSRFFKGKSRNPFRIPTSFKGSNSQLLDKKQRKAILKRAFTAEEIPENVDVIVVGSGIGGLALAGFLSLAGRRCLVLEKHHMAGGCCHIFSKGPYEFDTGIHYIGDMREGTLTRRLLDQITDGGLHWKEMDPDFDEVHYVNSQGQTRRIAFTGNHVEMQARLVEHFPAEKVGIQRFFQLLKEMDKKSWHVFALKVLPTSVIRWLSKLGLLKLLLSGLRYSSVSLQEVLDGLTEDEDLKCVLGYCCGDYGVAPNSVPFVMHAMLLNHFMKYGAFYPVGGPSEIVLKIVPVIEKTGGRLLVKAQVMKLLSDEESHQRIVGVRVCPMEKKRPVPTLAVDIHASTVVSACGVIRTMELLDEALLKQSLLHRVTPHCRPGVSCFSIYIGYSMGVEEMQNLGLKAQNVWAFSNNRLNHAIDDYLQLDAHTASNTEMPLLFLSFPSLKDPTWSRRHPGRSTLVGVGLANYEWFSQWDGSIVKKRGEDYKLLKDSFQKQMLRQIDVIYPQLANVATGFVDFGTPLTNQFYLNSSRGEIYGLDHDLGRFQTDVMTSLRPNIGIPGLLLSGQDVSTCGFTGAFYGAVLCANDYLQRNLLSDINSVTKHLRVRKKKIW